VPASGGDDEKTLVWVDREGNAQPLAAQPRAFADPRLSNDDRQVAVTIGDATKDVWTYDIAASQFVQFTFEGGTSPVWCVDGGRVIFAANRGGSPDIFSKALDASSTEERLTRTPRTDVPASCARDGTILFVESDASGRDIAVLSSDRTVRPLLATDANEAGPTLSPDGGVVAYVSDTSGRPEVYVAVMTDPHRATQVSSGGGSEPVWKRDGSELYFRSGNRMMAATVRTRPSLNVQSPRQLFTGTFETGAAWRAAYDVSRDGSRFLMIRSATRTEPGSELRILLGWKAN
jgi:Tol biopolymer transport system component